MLNNLVYLHSAPWIDFRIRFPSIQEGLLIDIKEYKEVETTTNHTLIKLKWTRREGANVKVSQHKIVAPMLSNFIYLYSSLWTNFHISFPSIEDGLLINIEEYAEELTTINHPLIKFTWTTQEGAIVKVSQQIVEVNANFVDVCY
jgi:hypothetical protein